MKPFFASSILIALVLLVSAPQTTAQTAYPVTVKHDAGETTVSKRPQRVIAIGDIHFEELLALGIQPEIGRAHV